MISDDFDERFEYGMNALRKALVPETCSRRFKCRQPEFHTGYGRCPSRPFISSAVTCP